MLISFIRMYSFLCGCQYVFSFAVCMCVCPVSADKCPSRCRAAPVLAVVASVRNVVASSWGTLIERPSPGAIRFSYQLEEAHIHFGMKNTDGSEHQISGRAFPAEVSACTTHQVSATKYEYLVCLVSKVPPRQFDCFNFVHMINFYFYKITQSGWLLISLSAAFVCRYLFHRSAWNPILFPDSTCWF